MKPQFPDFKMLDLRDETLIKEFAARASARVCEFSFANLMAWRDFDRPSYTFIDDCLCVRIDPMDEPPFFLEPLGSNVTMNVVNRCIQNIGKISRVSLEFVDRYCDENFNIRPLRDHFDYVYRVDELKELKGRKFDGKRNRIKNFMREHPKYKYVELEKQHANDALKLLDDWFRIRRPDDYDQPDLDYTCQVDAIERIFEYYDELKLSGGALLAEDKFSGFVVGSALSKQTACVHFCYSDPRMKGSFQTLLWEACRGTFSSYEHVNLEQDLGIVGLRRNKNSYYPSGMEEKFEVVKRVREL